MNWLRDVAVYALISFALLAAGFASGYAKRGQRADVQAIQATADARAAEVAQAQADAIRAAQNAMQAAADTRERLAELVSNETHFKNLATKVADYVRTHPDDGSCSLDAGGMQLWREANAGRPEQAGGDQP